MNQHSVVPLDIQSKYYNACSLSKSGVPQAMLHTLQKLREEVDQSQREHLSVQLSVKDSKAQVQNITYVLLAGTFIPFALIHTFVFSSVCNNPCLLSELFLKHFVCVL